LAQPKKFLEDFSKFIDVVGKVKLRAMIVLFNAWHAKPDFGGFNPAPFKSLTQEQLDRTFKFADDILDRHGEDERIYAWDLCNEPDLHASLDIYYPWLKQLHDRIKSRKEKTVLTIGDCMGLGALKKYEPLSDILGTHPYFGHRKPNNYSQNPKDYDDKVAGYKNNLDSYVKFANEVNKPIIASEIGSGDLNDVKRIEKLQVELSSVNERKIGWMIHALCHSPVADLHRPEYGPIEFGLYMACIEPDGSLRPGHEIIRDFLKQ
jgi:endo-1,4-beta-mannosidase